MSDLVNLITNKDAIERACSVDKKVQYKLLALASEASIADMAYYEPDYLRKFSEVLGMGTGELLDLLGLHISVLRVFMETDDKQFKATLAAAGFSAAYVENFPLEHKGSPVSLILSGSHGGIQKLSSFKWRVDISFACGKLSKRVPPIVIISLLTNNGQKFIFEVNIATFHRLNFNISLAIKELSVLKSALNNKVLV